MQARDPWDVRKVQGHFSDLMRKVVRVKSLEYLAMQRFRLGVVNGNIWMRRGKRNKSFFIVYDTNLNRVADYSWDEIRLANGAQQVSANEVMILTIVGLHIVSPDGRYQYKVMNGRFTDISLDRSNDEVAVMENNENRVVFLHKERGKWLEERSISFNEMDKRLKTIVMTDEGAVFAAVKRFDRVLKLNRQTGDLIQQYGFTRKSKKLGEFNGVWASAVDDFDCAIICDSDNHRFQVLQPDGTWEEVKVTGLCGVRDFLVIDDNVFILHRDKVNNVVNCKLSKYSIQN